MAAEVAMNLNFAAADVSNSGFQMGQNEWR